MIGESHRLIHSCVLHDRGMSKHVQICRATVVRTIFNSANLTGSSYFRRDCVHFKVRLQNNVWYAWKEIFLLITTPVALLVMHEANISSSGPQTSAELWTTATLVSTPTQTRHLATLQGSHTRPWSTKKTLGILGTIRSAVNVRSVSMSGRYNPVKRTVRVA